MIVRPRNIPISLRKTARSRSSSAPKAVIDELRDDRTAVVLIDAVLTRAAPFR